LSIVDRPIVVWVGASKVSGTFRWYNGNLISDFLWDSGQPNNAGKGFSVNYFV